MCASARGLAKLGAYMANQGKLGDKVLLKESSYQELVSDFTSEYMFGFGHAHNFSKGGVAKYGDISIQDRKFDDTTNKKSYGLIMEGRENFIGW